PELPLLDALQRRPASRRSASQPCRRAHDLPAERISNGGRSDPPGAWHLVHGHMGYRSRKRSVVTEVKDGLSEDVAALLRRPERAYAGFYQCSHYLLIPRVPASPPMAAPITIGSPGAKSPRRCRWRTARAPSSNASSVMAARPIRRRAWRGGRTSAAMRPKRSMSAGSIWIEDVESSLARSRAVCAR